MLCPFGLGVFDEELSRNRSILYITITAWLVQLMTRQSRTGSRRVRLNGITFIEQTLVVELLQKPPKGLDKFIVIRDIRVVEVNEIPHFLRKFTPFSSEHHHVFTTFLIIVFCRDILL